MNEWESISDKLKSKEDSIGFVRALSLEGQFSRAIAKMYADSSPAGIEEALRLVGKDIQAGNEGRLPGLLLLQAEMLNHIFINNIAAAYTNKDSTSQRIRSEIALKAQNQSRRTVMSLADLQNPKRPTFIKNQNNAVNQQVNLGNQKGRTDEAQGEESQDFEKTSTNEVIEDLDSDMDTRTKAAATRGDTAMETLGKGVS